MNNYLQTGFYARRASCNFRYNPSFFTSEIDKNAIEISNPEKEMIYCKNETDYIRRFIEHIKEQVIKKCKNLDSVQIILATFDKDNIIHKLMVAITTLVRNLLKIREKVNLYKSIVVFIEYEGQPVFMGNLNFTGLD